MMHGKEKSKNGGKNYMVSQSDVLQLASLNQGFLWDLCNKGSSYFKDKKIIILTYPAVLPHHGRGPGKCSCRDKQRTLGVYAKSIYFQQGHLRCEGYPSCLTKANRQLY